MLCALRLPVLANCKFNIIHFAFPRVHAQSKANPNILRANRLTPEKQIKPCNQCIQVLQALKLPIKVAICCLHNLEATSIHILLTWKWRSQVAAFTCTYLVLQSSLLRNIETHFRIFLAFSCAGLVDKLELLLQDPQKHLLECSSLEFSRAAARLWSGDPDQKLVPQHTAHDMQHIGTNPNFPTEQCANWPSVSLSRSFPVFGDCFDMIECSLSQVASGSPVVEKQLGP